MDEGFAFRLSLPLWIEKGVNLLEKKRNFDKQYTIGTKNIEHLCIYGKFEKDTNNIDVEEIIKASDAGFVFIVDAINEMSEEGQYNLLGVLTELKKYPIVFK